MCNIKTSWFLPDKLFKDIQRTDLIEASKFAKGKLLDIGCGSKPYKKIFVDKINKYIGLDPYNDEADIKEDFLKTSFKDNEYDTVLATQVLEHIEDPEEFLRKVNKLLKGNSYVILTAPLLNGVHESPRDFYRYTKFGLRYLFEKNNFEVVYIKEQGNYFTSLSFQICFYLEETMNRFFLKYPKRLFVCLLQYIFYLLSKLPSKFTKSEIYPLNYIIVAKKK